MRTCCSKHAGAPAAGTAPACTLWQRINVMQALRALAGDAYILYFLFTTYDLKQARRHPSRQLACPFPPSCDDHELPDDCDIVHTRLTAP